METVYTEATLKNLTKTQLLEITAKNEIKADETMKNDDIKALILEKGCPYQKEELKKIKPQNAPTFKKEQILNSGWFSHRRDILNVLLNGEEEYTHSEVDKILSEFMKGKVK